MKTYHLSHGHLEVELIDFGASLSSLKYKNHQVLRQITLDDYSKTRGHFGSIAGPMGLQQTGRQKVPCPEGRYHHHSLNAVRYLRWYYVKS